MKLQISDNDNREKDIQVMKVIHDLKNPILSIKSSLTDMAKFDSNPAIQTTLLECLDMQEMLECMRAEFKLKQGMQLKEVPTKVKTSDISNSFAFTHSELTKKGRNRMTVLITTGFPKVMRIPRTIIKRIANNLITNSLKHTEKGEVHVEFKYPNEVGPADTDWVQVGATPEPIKK